MESTFCTNIFIKTWETLSNKCREQCVTWMHTQNKNPYTKAWGGGRAWAIKEKSVITMIEVVLSKMGRIKDFFLKKTKVNLQWL